MKILHSKWLKISFAALLALALASALAVAVKYHSESGKPSEIVATKLEMSPSEKIRLGDKVALSCELTCPWGNPPVAAEIIPGKGAQAPGKAKFSLQKVLWGRNLWKMSGEVQPFINGEVGRTEIEINFEKPLKDGTKTLKMELPSFESESLDTGSSNEILLAGALEQKKEKASFGKWIGLTAFILVLAVILALYFRKKTKFLAPPQLSPWQIALLDICEIRTNLSAKKITPEFSFTKLTDILRNYLEKRFRVRATAQTTGEFLNSLKRGSSPMEDRHKAFLGEFLEAADLVKFANLPAEIDTLERAISKAEELVKSTVPSEASLKDSGKTKNGEHKNA